VEGWAFGGPRARGYIIARSPDAPDRRAGAAQAAHADERFRSADRRLAADGFGDYWTRI